MGEKSTDPILAVEDLEVSYGKVEAVRGVALEVPAGGLVTVVGANGAGKSSVINAISGVVKSRRGRVTYRGATVTKTGAHTLVRRGLVQVPEGRQVLAGLTIEDNLRLGGWHTGTGAIGEVYDRFPILRERRSMPAGSLSGGEQQMLAIGRALMARPQLILLDEPSMGLAPKIVDEVFEVIASIREGGTAVLLVEQNARRALAAAEYGYVMAGGEIVRRGPAAELLADDSVVQAYLGTGE